MKTSITPSLKQEKGIQDTADWFNNKTKQIWTIGGIAGSGKSTLLSLIMEKLGLNEDNTAVVAFTGAASCVLIQKGLVTATTIHRFMYVPVEVEDPKTHKKKITFKLRESIDENIKLIIIEEVSMVSDTMIDELASFKVPMLLIGDPFQLKPVFGNMNKYIQHPDVFLDEPMRQSLENPIYWLANQLRQYKKPPLGNIGGTVNIYRKINFPITSLTKADQIIAGKNKTCDNINKLYRRQIRGIKSALPVNGDKLLCYKNNWNAFCRDKLMGETYLVNGLLGYASDIEYDNDTMSFTMTLQPTYMVDGQFEKLYGDTLYFYDTNVKDDRDYIQENYPDVSISRIPMNAREITLNYFLYGNCITVYKSQGMETNKVLYFDEMLSRDTYFSQFYTAVTRAKQELDVVM